MGNLGKLLGLVATAWKSNKIVSVTTDKQVITLEVIEGTRFSKNRINANFTYSIKGL